jgi:DNA-binding transcriptional LysR family regulator
MPYTLRQLEYFIAAGETGSITLASERIHISQPSISTAISHLEKEFGVRLFIRHHAQGLSLTPAGRDLLREAKNLIAQAEGLYTLASETTGKVRGPLSLGCMVTLAPMLVPELAQSFQTAFPATQVRHIEGNQEQLLEGLRRAEVDVAIAYDLNTPEDILFKPLASLPPHVLVSEAHPFARQAAVSLRELESEPMILLDLPLSREYFLSLFHSAGLQPRVVARSGHQEVVRTMVANGCGYSIFNVRPRSNHALDGRKLVRVRLTDTHRPMIIGTATLKHLRQSRLVEAFETHCRSFISEAYIPGMVAPVLERAVRVRDGATTAV